MDKKKKSKSSDSHSELSNTISKEIENEEWRADNILIIRKSTGEWIKEFDLFEKDEEEEIKAIKEYLSESDEYDIVFRKNLLITGATFREEYDFAKAHPNDYYYFNADLFVQFVNESADYFNEQLKEYLEETENNWDDKAPHFFWARLMSATEERTVRAKYGI